MSLSISRRSNLWLVACVAVAAFVMLAFPATGRALPAYTQATGQPCTACHTTATGGALTSQGSAFAAIATHASNPAAAWAQVAGAAPPAPAAPAAPAAAPAAAAPAAAAPAAAPARLPSTGEPGQEAEILLALVAFGLFAVGAGLGLRGKGRAA